MLSVQVIPMIPSPLLEIEYNAIESIGRFVIFFSVISVVQHFLMAVLYRNVFVRVSSLPLVSTIFTRPTVLMHELFGHLIPALLSGSNIIGMDLEEHKGQVSVKYEKNMFGMISVFIAGFGPTFFLPLIFIALTAYVNSYDILHYAIAGDPIHKFISILADISRMDELKDVLLLYTAIVIAPGAASSEGDIKSVIAFVKSSPFMVVIVGLALALVLYISYVEGFRITYYVGAVIVDTFAAFMAMYILSALFLSFFAIGGGYVWGMVAFIAVFGAAKLLIPAFDFPLIAGLTAADIALLIKSLKIKHRIS